MSIALDGFKVLKRMGDAPDAFRAVRADADKAARTLVVKCLKAKATGIAALREMQKALRGQFDLLADAMTDAEMKTLLTRLDKHHPASKTMSAQERRSHILALARGDADPAPPVARRVRRTTKKVAKKNEPVRLQSAVADLIRAGGDADDD